jgi:hypothetical protein
MPYNLFLLAYKSQLQTGTCGGLGLWRVGASVEKYVPKRADTSVKWQTAYKKAALIILKAALFSYLIRLFICKL